MAPAKLRETTSPRVLSHTLLARLTESHCILSENIGRLISFER